MARTLAIHEDASLGVEHIEALAGPGSASAAAMLEARHEARSHSPRYSLIVGLADAFDNGELGPELDRALEHFTGWAEDAARAGSRAGVLRETASLVALLERAQAAGRADDVVRLALAVEGALAWGNRWKAWERVLELVLAAARQNGDSLAEAAALHQLGTRAYGSGDARTAVTVLERALALRERIGDVAGAETTRRNLRVVNGRAPLPYRLSHLPLAMLAVVCALLIGAGGVAGAAVMGPRGHEARVASVAALSVAIEGDGRVVSQDGSIDCAERQCRQRLGLQREILLPARPQLGWELSRWTEGCSGRGACRLLLTRDTRVVAPFKRVRDPRTVTVVLEGAGTVVSHPAGIFCQAHHRCAVTFMRSRALELTAAAARGHRFAGWTGDCDSVGRCRIPGDGSAAVVRARFVADPQAATLSVERARRRLRTRHEPPVGHRLWTALYGRLRPRHPRRSHGNHPDGSGFAGWNDPGCAPTADRRICTVTLGHSPRLIARFDRIVTPSPHSRPPPPGPPPPPIQETLTVSVDGDGHGSITSDSSRLDRCFDQCTRDFPAGERVELRATEQKGSLFADGRATAAQARGLLAAH